MSADRNELFEYVSHLIDENRLIDAKECTLKIETEIDLVDDDCDKLSWRSLAAPLLIDVGSRLQDTDMIKRGIEHFHRCEEAVHKEGLANVYYNLANGHSELWRLDPCSRDLQVDTDNHLLARRYYRLATSGMTSEFTDKHLACLVWTNYGNLLDGIGRNVEALSAYDAALRIMPTFGMALGNKGVTLRNFAPLMPGYSHILYFESIDFLESALHQSDLTPESRNGFKNSLHKAYEVVEHHSRSGTAMDPEQHIGVQPTDEFHMFLCEYCSEYDLFLSPVSRVPKDETPFYGDPLHLLVESDRAGEDRLKKYMWFLNEIKQEYVLGRYFLVQSQMASELADAVDEGVTLVHPEFDFPIFFGTNIQLLQSALKQAVAVLDKVAYFLYDYCKLNTQPDRISFLTIWGDLGNQKIQKGFQNYICPYLFALFTLARDLYKDGDWNTLIEDRGVVTHRFMILQNSADERQSVGDVPMRHLSDFLSNTVFALRISKAAVMYLIMFFNHFEYWKPIHEETDELFSS